MHENYDGRRRWEQTSRSALAEYQLHRLNELVDRIVPRNRFYAERLRGLRLPFSSLAELENIPPTTKQELIAACQSDPCIWQTYEAGEYVRVHRTSGTAGDPLYVYDTASDWQWWVDTWQYVLDAASIRPADRVLLAFSFGPFIGFWSAHDALVQRGALVIPTGGMSTEMRLQTLYDLEATVVCCTPTYAWRMVEVAQATGINLPDTAVRALIVAGEPGGSIPAIRQPLEAAWNAHVIDHAGATEVGPWGYADSTRRGLHVVETEFIAEFLPAVDGAAGDALELILTPLGRTGMPLIRYRTGDLVRPAWNAASAGNQFVLLDGGVLGRADDMLIVRGVNVFPAAIEAVVRSVTPQAEFRLSVDRGGPLPDLIVQVEGDDDICRQCSQMLAAKLGLRVTVMPATPGTLPRFEAKSNRLQK